MDDTPNNVIRLIDRRKDPQKELKELFGNIPVEMDDIFYASDSVLDAMEEHFDYGVSVGLLDGKIQVSSTAQDIDTIIWLLEEALEDVKNEY